MSERMTADRLSLLTDPEAGAWTDDEANEVAREAIRARRSESQQQDRIHALEVQQAELIRQAKEKDATIKALADAVELSGEYLDGDWHSSACPGWDVRPGPCGESCAQRRAALRLAGRLK